jgi:hypothetical protein
MIDTKKKTKNENTAETFKATKAASTVCARNKKEHVLIEKNDARVSRKNSSKSDLALALPSTDRNNKQQKLPVGVWNKKKFYKKVKVEDEVFKVGDDVYVCTPETVDLTEDVGPHLRALQKNGRRRRRRWQRSRNRNARVRLLREIMASSVFEIRSRARTKHFGVAQCASLRLPVSPRRKISTRDVRLAVNFWRGDFVWLESRASGQM